MKGSQQMRKTEEFQVYYDPVEDLIVIPLENLRPDKTQQTLCLPLEDGIILAEFILQVAEDKSRRNKESN